MLDSLVDPTDPRLRPYTHLKESAERLMSDGRFIAETAVVVERILRARPDLVESVLDVTVVVPHDEVGREQLAQDGLVAGFDSGRESIGHVERCGHGRTSMRLR